MEENFDRFVAVKASSDGECVCNDMGTTLMVETVVYKDMKEGFLAEDTDHGTRELREIFKGISSRCA